MKIKVISLWQPWATAMARRDKAIETRSWYTSHRGWLAIHAAKRKPDAVPRSFGTIPFGAVVCIAWMTACIRTEALHPTSTEEQWGDYSQGRFGWVTDPYCLIDLKGPIPLCGHQGLFDWEVPEEICQQFPQLRDSAQYRIGANHSQSGNELSGEGPKALVDGQ